MHRLRSSVATSSKRRAARACRMYPFTMLIWSISGSEVPPVPCACVPLQLSIVETAAPYRPFVISAVEAVLELDELPFCRSVPGSAPPPACSSSRSNASSASCRSRSSRRSVSVRLRAWMRLISSSTGRGGIDSIRSLMYAMQPSRIAFLSASSRLPGAVGSVCRLLLTPSSFSADRPIRSRSADASDSR
uniref:Uncharacterized protein n=1 Tax=Anopheles merus TaxID=30066 RepID=A0A182VNX4_ANOME